MDGLPLWTFQETHLQLIMKYAGFAGEGDVDRTRTRTLTPNPNPNPNP